MHILKVKVSAIYDHIEKLQRKEKSARIQRQIQSQE